MRLHWLQVRRARGLPMPLPPKPKRPLGPPVLFEWQGASIRTRADIEATGQTWEEFLDTFTALDILDVGLEATQQVVKLVPPGERLALSREIRRRRMAHQESKAANGIVRRQDEIAEQTSWFERLLRRA